MEPAELAALCRDTKTAWQALGAIDYERKSSAQRNVIFRRSLYFAKDIQICEIITSDAIRSIRPGHGLPPKFLDKVVGQVAKRKISSNQPVTLDLLP